jgi:hypothetical protein
VQTNDSHQKELTTDDLDMLQEVLMHVRGSFPDTPYRQADYDVTDDQIESSELELG